MKQKYPPPDWLEGKMKEVCDLWDEMWSCCDTHKKHLGNFLIKYYAVHNVGNFTKLNIFLLNQACTSLCAWFLKIDPVWIVGMHVCLCVCVCVCIHPWGY